MPGVPSGRGCEACRKQKKKCDQLQPSCSRCTRLQINCIGCGQQRYKFKEQFVVSRSTETRVEAATVSISSSSRRLSPNLSSDTLLALNGFISTLDIKDLRYDLTYYGSFFKDMPRRLGTNDALDASVSALTAAFPSVYAHQQSTEMLAKYVKALKTLRICLMDPTKAYTANTMCAIYLIGICQSWLGRHDDKITSHGEIMAHFLNSAPIEDWRDSFEIEMLITVCAPVIMESFVNPKIQLDTFFSNLTKTYGRSHGPHTPPELDDGGPIQSINLRSVSRMSEFCRNPELHVLEITSVYDQLRTDSRKIRQRLVLWTEALAIREPLQQYPIRKQHSSYQAAYGTVNAMLLILGSILRIFNPEKFTLAEDSARCTTEVIWLAGSASQYRPLGSAYMPFCFIAAWAATDGTPMQAEIEGLLEQWQLDLPTYRWMDMATWLRSTLEDLRLRLAISQLDYSPNNMNGTAWADLQERRDASAAVSSCCIL